MSVARGGYRAPRDAALAFLDRFCAGDVEGLAALLAPELRVAGPLYRLDSREAYLEALRADPPLRCGYRLLSITEAADEALVLYDYRRPGGALTIAQHFRLRDGLIVEMLLVFDTTGWSAGDG